MTIFMNIVQCFFNLVFTLAMDKKDEKIARSKKKWKQPVYPTLT